MAVDDAAADVSVSGGTPALRLKGARAPPYGGSHASRSHDYMNNPHLCLTAAQQLDKARSDAAAGLVQAGVEPMLDGEPDPLGPRRRPGVSHSGNLCRCDSQPSALALANAACPPNSGEDIARRSCKRQGGAGRT